jgi:hypothetical protein
MNNKTIKIFLKTSWTSKRGWLAGLKKKFFGLGFELRAS